MAYGDLVARVDFDMTRASSFSYNCHACKRCCRNKAIRVNPYEVLRLARRLGLSTTEFIERKTEAGGTVLRSAEDGNCVFLNEQGCSVHPDRPLACRIYPLARWVSAEGEESFGHLAPHPQTEGVYGNAGTVQDYLDQQVVEPYFRNSDRYGVLYDKMLAILEKADPHELDRRQDRRKEIDELPSGSVASAFMDIDSMVRTSLQDDPDKIVERHIKEVEKCLIWIDGEIMPAESIRDSEV
ncbi:hypothetical protein CK489_02700 [Bradyrhizobium sp. UFLA03-84]|uniref:YkgJ family cysteine cluster protein n=1 Tax=Bradyrhizobium sp. UFLA03-84 TaxID=418599 RepID=UPI000BAE37ED|nr:YkgJ family cysteine cluster protein [Bradyrhizobium sp. UFLA03-84]PAY09533.1 hypothetical protein CK489_02700 [Bradyrhizobium sp. UFLA03-84]